MKNVRFLTTVCLAAVTMAVFADDELVTDVTASQNWPWSSEVNIAYRYNGTNPTSIWFTATWQGQTNPVDVVQLDATGSYLVGNGPHCLKWDPVAAGYGKQALVDFKVQATVTNADPRTYLVVDLKNGGYSTLSSVPADGWSDDYKSTKMVFRRIPAGTYRLGTSESEYRAAFGDNGQAGAQGRGWTLHNVTYTSDYYFQVFAATESQFSWITSQKEVSGGPVAKPTQGSYGYYSFFRGEKLDDGVTVVEWPLTGHRVNASSYVGRMRQITSKKGQMQLLADLPTDQQWTFAMSGGKNTFLPTGGTSADSDQWVTYFAALCHTKPLEHDVGLLGHNDFGIYDFNVRLDPCLDWLNADYFVDGVVPHLLDRGDRLDDPGSSTPCYLQKPGDTVKKYWRVSCGAVGSSTITRSNTIFSRNAMLVDGTTKDYRIARFVINLKPIVDVQ